MADEGSSLPTADAKILPPKAEMSKEAKQTIEDCAAEFISFLTCEAYDKCQRENRREVNGEDICWALSTIGIDRYDDAMEKYLHKHREAEQERVGNESNKSGNDGGNERDPSNVMEKGSSSSAP